MPVEPPPGSPEAPSVIVPDAADSASGQPAWAARLQHHREAVNAALPGNVEEPEDGYEASDSVGSLPRRNKPDLGAAAKAASAQTGGDSRRGSILSSASQSLDQHFNEKRRRESLKRRARRMSLQQQFVGDSTSGQSVESIKDLLLPGSRTRTYWEMLIAAMLLVQFVMSPYVAAFLLFPRRPFLHAWTSTIVVRFVIDSTADLLYIIDICIRSQTYHFNSKGDLVLDRKAILKRYFRSLNPSFSFAVDAAATLPPMVGEICILFIDGDAWLAWGSIRFLLVLRMPRLVKTVGQILRACMTMFNFTPSFVAMLRLFSLFGLLLLISHWSACIYFVLNLQVSPTWEVDLLAMDNSGAGDMSIYVLSLYYSFLAILGNDVPSNSRIFSISTLMVGAVLVATIFGNMTVLLANADAQTRAHYEKLERVKQSLVRMELSPKLQSRVIKYYEYMWRRQKSGTDGQQGNFVTELPMALKAESTDKPDAQYLRIGSVLTTVPNALLYCRRRLFLQDIVAALVGRIYGPGDNIIVEGDTGKEMFFLEAGLVQVIKAQPDGSNKVIVELGKGNFFGEMSLLEARGKTSAGILATTFCDVQVLPKTSFEQIMDDWPEYLPRFMAVALKRKEDTIKREQAPTEEGGATSTMEVGFDVRRRKVTQGAWKNAGKAIMASNNLQKLKASSKNAPEAGAAATASAALKLVGGLSRGRTLSGNPVTNDVSALAKVAGLSISASPMAESVEGQDSVGPMRPRSAAAMKRAMGLDRTSSARSLDGSSPSVALRRAMSAQADDLDNSQSSGGAPVALVEDLTDRLGSVESAVDNMGSQLAVIQNALEVQASMLKQVLQQQKQQAALLESPRRNGHHALLGSDSESATVLAAEREIAKSITARSPEQSSRDVPSSAEASAGASTAGASSSGVPPAPSTAPPSGQRRKGITEEEGDLNLDDENISAMDVEALLAIRADGNI